MGSGSADSHGAGRNAHVHSWKSQSAGGRNVEPRAYGSRNGAITQLKRAGRQTRIRI
jgi:hypothetical protein